MRRAWAMVFLTAMAVYAAAPDGEALYKEHCAMCHDGAAQARMPTHDELHARTPEAVYQAMSEGAMKTQSTGLSPDDERAIARYLTGKEFGALPASAATKCSAAPGALKLSDADWNGWGDDLANTRYQPKPGLSAADVPKLKLKWAFAFAGDTVRSAQPVIVGGRVFVGSSTGGIYSLDAATGCTWWKYDAGIMVRTAITVGQVGGKTIAWFGDVRSTVHAVDAMTGALLWKVKVEDHPVARITGSPTFYGGRVYVPVSSIEEAVAGGPRYECCTFRGSIVALDGATGKQIWKSYTIPAAPQPTAKSATGIQLWGPAGAAIWSAPTIDVKRHAIYAGTANSYTNPSADTTDAIVAFDLDSGALLWKKQVTANDYYTMVCGRPGACTDPGPDHDFGSSPILRELPGGKRVLVCGQKSGIVWGLDPDDRGKVLWQTRVGAGGPLGGIEWGPAADLEYVYAAVSDLTASDGKLPGGLHALKLATGEKVWSTPAPALHCKADAPGCSGAQSAAISAIPGVVFSGSIDGHFRAYQAKTGEIVWDFDSVREFETVNGVPGKGGSFDSAGPAIANGMVFTNSGYGMWLGLPGNVLLAFGK